MVWCMFPSPSSRAITRPHPGRIDTCRPRPPQRPPILSRALHTLASLPRTTSRPDRARFLPSTAIVGVLFAVFAALLCALALLPSAQAAKAEELDTTVEYLIGQVSGSDLTFIRNADHYRGAEAAEHIRRKYAHFKDEIRTPEEFIARCATRSLMSGEPYLVITEQGEKIPTSDWLNRVLEDYRARRRQGP